MSDQIEDWEAAYQWRALDGHLGGGLQQAFEMLQADHTSKLFGFFREDLAGRAGEAHERKHGLLTPEALADQARREGLGRAAFAAMQADNLYMEYKDASMQAIGHLPGQGGGNGQAAPGCMRGMHAFGALRGPNGEAECRHCGVVVLFPKAP